jgi:polyisoprenyl-teichoic acid--peptidoglycan teichoic acid transferase
MNDPVQPATPTKSRWKIIRILIFLAIVVALSLVTFNTVSGLVTTWDITSLPGLALVNPTPTHDGDQASLSGEAQDNSANSSVAQPMGLTPDPWDGANRVTVLVMGLDYNDWRAGEGPPRTDTMILLTIDPLSNTAGMLSIPRDLWVSIPGFDYGKINTAYQLGESFKVPGGGPALAMDTVEHLIGVPIQYYAQIDFNVFVQFIDEIHGVKLTVPEEIYVDIYDDDKGKIRIKPGLQVLPGAHALAYARARNTEGADFDRAQRQQQVIMAIRERVMDPKILAELINNAPSLYSRFSSGINTNLSLDEVIKLGWLAMQIPSDQIYKGIIGEKQINFGKSPDGLDVLKPLPDQIRLLRDEIFAPSGSISPIIASDADPQMLMSEEAAQIIILNGTFTTGLASQTSEYLQSLGANVIGTNDASEKPYPYTTIYDHTGNPYTLEYLVELMNISKYRVLSRYSPDSQSDVTVIVGNDWAANNPMP